MLFSLLAGLGWGGRPRSSAGLGGEKKLAEAVLPFGEGAGQSGLGADLGTAGRGVSWCIVGGNGQRTARGGPSWGMHQGQPTSDVFFVPEYGQQIGGS
jgi:hypothetical protein